MRRCETDRTKANCPRYTLSDRMVSLVAEITEVATRLEMRERDNK
jgi:rRNA maturation protein Nop10